MRSPIGVVGLEPDLGTVGLRNEGLLVGFVGGFVGHCRASLVDGFAVGGSRGHCVADLAVDDGAERCSNSASAVLIGCPVRRS